MTQVLKQDQCLNHVFEKHGLVPSPSLNLTSMIKTGPLLSRFTNRTVLEMIAFVEKSIAAYEAMCMDEGGRDGSKQVLTDLGSGFRVGDRVGVVGVTRPRCE